MVNCDDVKYLVAIYGIIIGGAVVGFSVCLATLLVMVNSISWKNPWKVCNITEHLHVHPTNAKIFYRSYFSMYLSIIKSYINRIISTFKTTTINEGP